jgi:hypothetical protein
MLAQTLAWIFSYPWWGTIENWISYLRRKRETWVFIDSSNSMSGGPFQRAIAMAPNNANRYFTFNEDVEELDWPEEFYTYGGTDFSNVARFLEEHGPVKKVILITDHLYKTDREKLPTYVEVIEV